MNLLQPTSQPARWVARSGGVIVLDGLTQVGEATASADLVGAEGDEAFVAAVAALNTAYRPLPETGQWCEQGAVYSYQGQLIVCRQGHNRTIYPPADTPALWLVYRAGQGVLAWLAGEQVYVGTRRTHAGQVYECLQAHVTQSDWQPDRTPALWRPYVVTPGGNAWTVGVAYRVGDEVTYQGRSYRCRQAHTALATWTPSVVPALWLAL